MVSAATHNTALLLSTGGPGGGGEGIAVSAGSCSSNPFELEVDTWTWTTVPLAYGFVARALSGPRFSPLGLLAARVVAPRISEHPKLVPGPPKRFAQGIGALFSLSALGLWLSGRTTASYRVLAALAVPATLEAALGYCVGCKIFALGMRLGLVPQSVCAECADLWGPTATEPRAATAAS